MRAALLRLLRTKLRREACECIGGSGKSLRGAGCGGFKLGGGKNAQRAWMAIGKMSLNRLRLASKTARRR
jgi:hypothetical protein